jgi:hypothetical protein
VVLSVKEGLDRGAADAEAEAEKKKSEEAKRKNKPKKVEAKKYYAVAVGEKTGVFTTWDECDRSVNKYPGCLFKSFKRRSEARAWLWEKRRQQQQPRRRRDRKPPQQRTKTRTTNNVARFALQVPRRSSKWRVLTANAAHNRKRKVVSPYLPRL